MRGKLLFSLAALVGTSSASMAINLQKPQTPSPHHLTAILAESPSVDVPPTLLAGTSTAYLCWSGSGTLASSGALVANMPTGINTTNGDDAHLNATGIWGTVGFSIANTDGADTLKTVEGEIDLFRQSDGSFIDGVSWTAPLDTILGSAGLAAGSSVRLSFADGAFESFGIVIDTPDIFITTTFTSATYLLGADPAGVGIQIRNPAGGPAAPGAFSNDLMVINGVPTATPFQPSFAANTSYFLRVAPVPEPGCLALLGLGAVGMLRRRK